MLICFTGAASRKKVPERPTPCSSRKSVNSQEDLIAKNVFFLRASRGVFFFPSPALSEKPSEAHSFVCLPRQHFFSALRAESSPMQAFPMCPCLKPYFFPRFARCMFFNRCKLPHEQNGSPRASPQTDLFYLVFHTKRIALPGLPREQILST